MENIKYAIRSSQVLNEIKNIETEHLSNILAAARQLGFVNVDYVQVENGVYDVWCNSEMLFKMEWRLKVTLHN